jgi:hypothetical protein
MSSPEQNLESRHQVESDSAPRVGANMALVAAFFVLAVAGIYFAGLYLIIR